MAAAGSGDVASLASSQGCVVGSSNLGGGMTGFCKDVHEELSGKYRTTLLKQIVLLRNSAEDVRFMILTELNPGWAIVLAQWLTSEECDECLKAWGIMHDEHDVALMWAPGVDVLAFPKWNLVYDDAMLAAAVSRGVLRDKLNWRRVLHGHFSIGAEHPQFFILGAHVIAGSKQSTTEDPRDSRVILAQKVHIATFSMLRGIRDRPSIVAGLREGNCVAVCLGDWNLDHDQMMTACKQVENLIMQDLNAEAWYGNICYEINSSWNNRDWIVSFYKQGLIHPRVILNSDEHLAAYTTGHLVEHQPVVMDLGEIRSLADQGREAPTVPRGANWRDWEQVQKLLQLRVADASENVQDPEDPATTSTATATTP